MSNVVQIRPQLAVIPESGTGTLRSGIEKLVADISRDIDRDPYAGDICGGPIKPETRALATIRARLQDLLNRSGKSHAPTRGDT